MRFLDDNSLLELLLYGHNEFNFDENRIVIKATIGYIRKTSRFSQC